MIKVKTFIANSYNPLHYEKLDNSINKFLEENDIEVVDIKYSTCLIKSSVHGTLLFYIYCCHVTVLILLQ